MEQWLHFMETDDRKSWTLQANMELSCEGSLKPIIRWDDGFYLIYDFVLAQKRMRYTMVRNGSIMHDST